MKKGTKKIPYLSRETFLVSGRYSAFLDIPLIKMVFEVVVRHTQMKNLISEWLPTVSEGPMLF